MSKLQSNEADVWECVTAWRRLCHVHCPDSMVERVYEALSLALFTMNAFRSRDACLCFKLSSAVPVAAMGALSQPLGGNTRLAALSPAAASCCWHRLSAVRDNQKTGTIGPEPRILR